ncbi:28S rRNA (cytosine-C(5))-methyltransferase isoform X2 [Aricia agestis]|uniref:28S rRNA (cytosine-C(5))-methyltransferase isoform X2 n=1 Tax=Aricia agestis TaxID=91739 RepID=UPI001C202757|nr:28S rRNA (cytosine-C(5))-methyltransferase isoform X2 [Aricia agestis]
MFNHSIKVPRHYKIAANIFKKVATEGGSVKTLLYDDKLRHFRTNVLFALITETIKHATQIDKILESSGMLEAETRFDPWLAKVLTAELLYGKKSLPGKSKPEQTILSYKDKFEKYISENGDDTETKVVSRPRYVRINTNLLTTSDAIRAFQDEGYKFIRCTSGSYDDYLQQIQNLTEYDFTQDYHVKTIFVFSSGTKFHEHELYYENKIILQDKATAMAVHLLAPPADSVILDMCAAPGMKTTQLAAYIRNQGKIYAVERNKERFDTLCDFVEKTGSKCVQTLHQDALELKRGDYDDVEYILLDPSCSGSGMQFSVHNYVEDTRMARLTSLQEKFLKHTMNAFPKAKRIVYSTCSLYPEENERVVTNVVKTSRARWRVQDVKELLKGQWNNFGSGMYGTMGARCLYAKPETDFTTGFFLAVLDRDQSDIDRNQGSKVNDNVEAKNSTKEFNKAGHDDSKEAANNQIEEPQKEKKNKKKKEKSDDVSETNLGMNIEEGESEVNNDITKESKKKKKNKSITKEENGILESVCSDESNDIKRKKKKKDKNEITKTNGFVNTPDSDISDVPKKKKKKNKEPVLLEESQDSQVHESTEVPKKKKKKRKNNDESVATEDTEFIETTENYDLNEVPKKKKKKDKSEKPDNIATNEDDNLNVSVKKKKAPSIGE